MHYIAVYSRYKLRIRRLYLLNFDFGALFLEVLASICLGSGAKINTHNFHKKNTNVPCSFFIVDSSFSRLQEQPCVYEQAEKQNAMFVRTKR